MEKEDIIFDPTDIQIDSYGKFNLGDLDVEEMTNEQSVKMLLYQHVLSLHELKSAKKELAEFKNKVEDLKDDREKLRIQLASAVTGAGTDIASVFVSFLGGFAINMLTSDWSSGMGWVIFIMCITIIFFFKYPSLTSVFKIKSND